MIDEIMTCLDGSAAAEKLLPLAQEIGRTMRATLTILRVVTDAHELAKEESYMRERARLVGGQFRFIISQNPGATIVEELAKNSNAVAALTTHGRTAWGEAMMGSVAMQVIRESKQPVILYRALASDKDAPRKISTLALALDGSQFAETVIPLAAEFAKSLSARLLLLQALPIKSPISPILGQSTSDIAESSYLHVMARQIINRYGVEAEWEVLHGAPAGAICGYLSGMPETMLVITTHARNRLEQVILGSVAAACVRGAGVPLLMYRPP